MHSAALNLATDAMHIPVLPAADQQRLSTDFSAQHCCQTACSYTVCLWTSQHANCHRNRHFWHIEN